MSQRPTDILAKGSNFLGLLKALNQTNAGTADRVLAALPREVGDALRYGHIVAVGWYPVRWYAELHAGVERVLSAGPSFARTLGHDATFADFTGIHRMIASVLTVETAFGQTPRLMALYWRGGKIERLELERGRSRIRFAGWHGFSRHVWEDIIGSTEAILELCGAKHIRCRAVNRLDDATTVDIELRWTSSRLSLGPSAE